MLFGQTYLALYFLFLLSNIKDDESLPHSGLLPFAEFDGGAVALRNLSLKLSSENTS